MGVAAVWDLEKTEVVEVRSVEREVDVEYFSRAIRFSGRPAGLGCYEKFDC